MEIAALIIALISAIAGLISAINSFQAKSMIKKHIVKNNKIDIKNNKNDGTIVGQVVGDINEKERD